MRYLLMLMAWCWLLIAPPVMAQDETPAATPDSQPRATPEPVSAPEPEAKPEPEAVSAPAPEAVPAAEPASQRVDQQGQQEAVMVPSRPEPPRLFFIRPELRFGAVSYDFPYGQHTETLLSTLGVSGGMTFGPPSRTVDGYFGAGFALIRAVEDYRPPNNSYYNADIDGTEMNMRLGLLLRVNRNHRFLLYVKRGVTVGARGVVRGVLNGTSIYSARNDVSIATNSFNFEYNLSMFAVGLEMGAIEFGPKTTNSKAHDYAKFILGVPITLGD